jgi:hypothetical protein
LKAVACVVQHGDRVLTQAVAEFTQCVDETIAIEVFPQRDAETGRLQGLTDQARIVDGVVERVIAVSRIADDQGDAFLGDRHATHALGRCGR